MDCWRIISWGLAPFTGHGNSTALVFSEILRPVLKDVAPPCAKPWTRHNRTNRHWDRMLEFRYTTDDRIKKEPISHLNPVSGPHR
jgi:hypothetical protein